MGGDSSHLIRYLDRAKKRAEIGVPLDAKLLISVGELSMRKNHRVVIEALNDINDSDIYYIIVGKGTLEDELEKRDLTGRLKLLGYRTDITELLHASDLFVFPSLQEGLPVALMEAMASGLPCICSRIRGNMDLIQDSSQLFEAHSKNEARVAINNALKNLSAACIERKNTTEICKFGINAVREEMKLIYRNLKA